MSSLAIYQRVSNTEKLVMTQSIAMHVNQATTFPGSPILPALPEPQVLEACSAPPAFHVITTLVLSLFLL